MSIPPPLTSQLTVLLFTDLLDSSKLKTQLGDRAYAEQVAAPHNRFFRELLQTFPGAAINNFMGDGFLATFTRVSDAVNFALLFHQRLDQAARSGPMPMTRIGIYVGELITLDDGSIAGHAADMCARLMSLGGGRQTLLTRHVFDDARQHVRVHPALNKETTPPELAWQAHGRYEFKGKEDDPLEVFEVGAVGFAPLVAPHDSEKARRKLNADEEATLGWRPAIGQEVPSKPHWILQKQLGAGGFGEVWLVKHRKTQEEKVFKFCFDPERLRSFKRELTLFRLLRKELGDRPDIAKIHDIRLDQPPFYLELDYAPLGNLQDWVATKQGLLNLPLPQRLDLLARVCDAVEAAHSIDVLHKDLKPSNILMYDDRGEIKPRLCDFGIGVLADLTRLENADITRMGFTQTLLAANESSRTGTRLYAPPETLMGQPFTNLGDVYALGVMLYQLVIGKFDQPIAYGWERDVAEGDLTAAPNEAGKLEQPSSIARAVYKETIGLAIEGNPTRRVPSAAELARLIRALPTTIETREAEETARVTELAKAETARKTRVLKWIIGIAVSVVAVVGTLGAMSYVQWQRADELATKEKDARVKESNAKEETQVALTREQATVINLKSEVAHNHYQSGMNDLEQNRFDDGLNKLFLAYATCPEKNPRKASYLQILGDRSEHLLHRLQHQGFVWSVAFSPDGTRVLTGSSDKTARLWDAHTGEPLGKPLQHQGGVNAVAFSPDGTRVLTGSDDMTARLWDAHTGEPLGKPLQHQGFVWSVAFSPDGTRVLTGSYDKTARLWDAHTGEPLGKPLQHQGGVNAVAFSPDGTRVLTGSDDMTARLWDAHTGEPLGKPLQHQGGVNAVAFSPDETRVLTGSGGDHRGKLGAARLWEVSISPMTQNLAALWSLKLGQQVSGDKLVPLVKEVRAALTKELQADAKYQTQLKSWLMRQTQQEFDSQATRNEENKNWYATVFYLTQLNQLEPKNENYASRLRWAKAEWAKQEAARKTAWPALREMLIAEAATDYAKLVATVEAVAKAEAEAKAARADLNARIEKARAAAQPKIQAALTDKTTQPIPWDQAPVKQGDVIKTTGQIKQTFLGKQGELIILNFGEKKTGEFCIVVPVKLIPEQEQKEAFAYAEKTYVGKTIVVTGLVEFFEPTKTPQITIDSLEQLQVLDTTEAAPAK